MKKKNGKNIYCMSFRWMRTPEVKKELQVVEQEAGFEFIKKIAKFNKARYTESEWKIINNYDEYGLPPTAKLELLAQEGNEIYGCGLVTWYYVIEKKDKNGISCQHIGFYWENVCNDQYYCNDDAIEIMRGDMILKEVPYELPLREDEVLIAIPYELPLTDSQGKEIGKVRLWNAGFRVKSSWKKLDEKEQKNEIGKMNFFLESIIWDLYFPLEYKESKVRCLGQKYFMVSATVQWAVKKHMENYGSLHNFQEKNVFLLCDEWSGLAIVELVRILQKEYGFGKKDAWVLAEQVCVYEMENPQKNLFEIWPEESIRSFVPEIYQLLKERNNIEKD